MREVHSVTQYQANITSCLFMWHPLWLLPLPSVICFLASALMNFFVSLVFLHTYFLCKFVIWTQRNDHRFRSVQPSAVNLIASIKARVKFYLPLLFKRFRSNRRRRFFVRQWGSNGTICTVDGSNVVFSSSC